jgi:hypothetical protein
VNAPRTWPEQLALQQVLTDRRDVDRHQRPAPARPAAPDRAREQLLAGATLAEHQHWERAVDDTVEQVQRAQQRRRLAEDLGVLVAQVGARVAFLQHDELLRLRGDALLEVGLLARQHRRGGAVVVEQTMQVHGDRGLVGERLQPRHVVVAERVALEAVVEVDAAEARLPHEQRHAQHRAQLEVGHALHRAEVALARIGAEHAGAVVPALADDGARHLSLGALHRLPIEAARHFDTRVVGVAREHETALRAEQRDRLVEQRGEQRAQVFGLGQRAVERQDRREAARSSSLAPLRRRFSRSANGRGSGIAETYRARPSASTTSLSAWRSAGCRPPSASIRAERRAGASAAEQPSSASRAAAATPTHAGQPRARQARSAIAPSRQRTESSTSSPHTGCSARPTRTSAPASSPAPGAVRTSARSASLTTVARPGSPAGAPTAASCSASRTRSAGTGTRCS